MSSCRCSRGTRQTPCRGIWPIFRTTSGPSYSPKLRRQPGVSSGKKITALHWRVRRIFWSRRRFSGSHLKNRENVSLFALLTSHLASDDSKLPRIEHTVSIEILHLEWRFSQDFRLPIGTFNSMVEIFGQYIDSDNVFFFFFCYLTECTARHGAPLRCPDNPF